MLHVNDDNNDELFRRAADNYPLKTDSPDWDAVLNKMNAANDGAEPEIIAKKRKNYYRYLLLLLLLIPVFIFENKQSFFGGSTAGKNSGQDKTVIAAETAKQPGNATSQAGTDFPDGEGKTVTQPDQKNIPTKPGAEQTQQPPVNTTEPVRSQDVSAIEKKKTNTPGLIAQTDNSFNNTNKKIAGSSKHRTGISIKNSQAFSDNDHNVNNKDVNDANDMNAPVIKNKKGKTIKKKTKGAVNIAITAPATDEDPSEKNTTTGDNNTIATTEEKSAPVSITVADEAEKKADSLKNETDKKKTAKEIATTKGKKKDDKKEKQKHFYIGVIGGPDFSAVKLQAVKKTGLGYGFVLGFKLTNRLSIETGLIKDKKYYDTDGKYFDKKNIPAYGNLDYVSGNCDMLELPVTVRYNFANRKKSSWFGALGFSSYFMQKESYIYDINYNGMIYQHAYDYSNKSTALFAAINISAGYTYKLGKIGDLRIEPYIKLPISKIGSGNLPIQSAGVYLGFTKTIF